MRTKANGALTLQQSVALLLQNQAKFVAIEVESAQRFARIERALEEINASIRALIPVVSRHDQEIRELTEALRKRVGFKSD